MTWSVIIPSRDDAKLLDCVCALFEKHPTLDPDQVVIVSDGLSLRTRWKLRGVRWVNGQKPFVFSRAINMGANATPRYSDLVILGDDVRFKTLNGIEELSTEAWSSNAAAVAPEVLGVCGQPAQRAGAYAQKTADWVAFICVYIRRRVWAEVGPLDERFTGYGYDDVDWCLRARDHGEMRIAHKVTVKHLDSSSYRSQADWRDKYEANRERFDAKWNLQTGGAA